MAVIDLRLVELSRKPNQYLAAPAGFCQNATPHAAMPRYPMPPERLLSWLREIALAEPRTRLEEFDQAHLRMRLIQRSKVFRFPDLIDLEVMGSDEEGATLAVYSRARYGYRDFGVNQARIDRWLAALRQRLAAEG